MTSTSEPASWEAQAIFDDYPEWLVSAADSMSRPPTSDLTSRTIGVTRLIDPAWQTSLILKHKDELPKRETGDMVPAMMGQAWHLFSEKYERNDALVERPFSAHFEVDDVDWQVRGIIDAFRPEPGLLVDKKTAKTWAYVFGKREWEEQLNVYKLLMELAGYRVKHLAVEVLYLDWNKAASRRNSDYPPAPHMVLRYEPWHTDDATAFVFSRLRRLMNPELCTPQERWERGEHWAVMKRGRKSAIKKHDSEHEANQAAAISGDFSVEHRPGVSVRCLDWCPVKEFCSFGQGL